MERARGALAAAAVVILAAGGAVRAAPVPPSTVVSEAAVGWPPATLLLSEVQTGGASASDEFVEITNAGAAAVDLGGLEIAYVTATGGTVTRKASWPASQLLDPGQHLLIANASGVHAGIADLTYSGGFAATGGALVLRPIGGAPIDAVGWGDASNDFVEGVAAAAPPAGSSLERLPGGVLGNAVDTNDNASDFFVQPAPNPQSLAAPPVPPPAPSPTPPPTEAPTASSAPTPVPTPDPTADLTPVPTIEPTAEPTLSPSPPPTAMPSPTLSPGPSPSPSPSPSASQLPLTSILAARGLPTGTIVRVLGVLTTDLGALEGGRKAFIQDDGAGIAVYLDAAVAGGLPVDTLVEVAGTIDERYGERTLRAEVADLVALGEQQRPQPWLRETGEIGEATEGYRVLVAGTTVGSPTGYADGLGILVDDGTGAVRVIVGPDALGSASVPAGASVIAVGPVGQRDSTGSGASGYRIHATEPGELAILPGPTPEPTPAPTPMPSATPGPTPSPPPPPSPTPTPSASPLPVLTIVEARAAGVGMTVTVMGVVTAEAGRLGTPSLLAIGDATGGIVVRLPDGVRDPIRGTTLVVTGPLADPYGQLELRPHLSGFQAVGPSSLPVPLAVVAGDLGEATEGALVAITGSVTSGPRKATSGDLSLDLVDPAGTPFRVMVDASSGIAAADLPIGPSLRLTGIAGQRATRKGALDGYRIWLRDRSDIIVVNAASGTPSAHVTPVEAALELPDGRSVVIEGLVTIGSDLLDGSGRRVVVQDASGAIEVVLAAGEAGPAVGTRLRVTGTTGHAWDAPRILAARAEAIGSGAVSPSLRRVPPGARDEWQLVRLAGTILKVERLGDRWRAELALGGSEATRVPIIGQAGAGIPSTAIVVGRSATIVGIVKRPYPTATDRRYAVMPRSRSDVAIGPAEGGASTGTGGATTDRAEEASSSRAAVVVTPDTDLATLSEHVGEVVRVGGLVHVVTLEGFELDDGTAIAPVVLRDGFAALLAHVRAGEAVAATGRVEQLDGRLAVVVDDAGALVRVGDLGQAMPVIGHASAPPAAHARPSEADAAWLGPTGSAGLAAALLVGAMSALVIVLRRRRLDHRLRVVVLTRLAGLRRRAGGA